MEREETSPSQDNAPVEGYIDVFKDEGAFEGWARSTESSKPRVVSIRVQADVVAQAVAEHYRKDLLEAAIGHGHYLFRAKVANNLPTGEHQATLWDEETKTQITTQGSFAFRVSESQARPTISCDDMLRLSESWDDQTLLANLHCLNLEYNLKIMGYERFIDVCYLYIFDRRADDGSRLVYKDALASGRMSEVELFGTLLQSDERKQRSTPLRSPYDARFPFVLHPREMDVVHSSIVSSPPRVMGGKKRGLHKRVFRTVKSLFR